MAIPVLMKKKLIFSYIAIEAVLLAALMTFQIITFASGFRIADKTGPYYPFIAIFQIALTAVTFLFLLSIFFIERKTNLKNRWNLIVIYGLLILLADIFFVFLDSSIPPHVCFLTCYLIFMFLRDNKWYEYLIRAGLAGAAILIVGLMGKLSPTMAVDICLGAVLIVNAIVFWIDAMKAKTKQAYLIAIAVTLILISDSSIVLRTFVSSSFSLSQSIHLVSWPTYVVGNCLIAYVYAGEEQLSNTSK